MTTSISTIAQVAPLATTLTTLYTVPVGKAVVCSSLVVCNRDAAATGCTFSSNDQVIWSGTVSESGDFTFGFTDREITLQPGESVTLAVRSVTSTATCIGSLNTREDQ